MYQTHHSRTTFRSSDVEKVHAVVARSRFRSQNVQNTPLSDHFWHVRCRKSARRCGAKQLSKSKCTKHTMYRPLLEVEMSKKCTALWREAHLEVKMYKAHHVRTIFGSSDVEKVHAVVARSTFRSQNVKKNQGFGPLLEVQMSTLHHTTLHYITLHSTTLRYTKLHYTTLHYTTLHYLPLHFTTLHYTTLLYTTTTTTQLHSTMLHSLHYTPLHSTTLKYTTLHYTTLQSTTLHYITLRYTPQHYNYNYTTTLHYTPPH